MQPTGATVTETILPSQMQWYMFGSEVFSKIDVLPSALTALYEKLNITAIGDLFRSILADPGSHTLIGFDDYNNIASRKKIISDSFPVLLESIKAADPPISKSTATIISTQSKIIFVNVGVLTYTLQKYYTQTDKVLVDASTAIYLALHPSRKT